MNKVGSSGVDTDLPSGRQTGGSLPPPSSLPLLLATAVTRWPVTALLGPGIRGGTLLQDQSGFLAVKHLQQAERREGMGRDERG